MAGVGVDLGDGVSDDRERSIAQEIDLDQSRILRAVLLSLALGELVGGLTQTFLT